MTAVVESQPILGTGQQIEYMHQAEAAARLSGFASNAASLCHALSRGVNPEDLQLLIERTEAFSEVIAQLDAVEPRARSYSDLIPFQVWRESTDSHDAGETGVKVNEVLDAIKYRELDRDKLGNAAKYFRVLAAKLAERGRTSMFAAQDSLRG